MRRAESVPGSWSWRFLMRIDAIANRVYGSRYNPLYQSGAIVVALLGILLVTGIYLLLFYRIGTPWESVSRITDQVWLGRWIRGLHRFASDAAVVATAVHAFRMYAQRRSWGARALAWLTGLLLLGVIFISGWTGYVLVWDLQAQLLAVEGARFLDLLPIFSEPIGRTFVGESPLPSGFFFLNLFAHIALPIGLGLLVWIHISRVSRPKLLPSRGVLVGVVGFLVFLAVVVPVGMAPKADLFRLPREVPLDLFFAFWLPVTSKLPAGVVWLLGGGLVALIALVPLWTRPAVAERIPKTVVNERQCTGCEQCMHDCPFEAITMIPRSDGRDTLVAQVDEALCVSCGICIASCAPMAIGPPGGTGRDQLAEARRFLAEVGPGPEDLIVVGCEWSAAGRHPGAAYFPVHRAGNLHTSVIEYLVRGGAGGVVVVSCPEEDCRGREGGKWLQQRVHHGREADLKGRVDRRRVRLVEAGAAEVPLLRTTLDGFGDEIAELARVAVDEFPNINGVAPDDAITGDPEEDCDLPELEWSIPGERPS